jgi:hypothetical protein
MSRCLQMTAAGLLLSMGVAQGASAQEGAVVPLPHALQGPLQQYLPGVVGEPVPAFPIEPGLAMVSAGTRQYQVIRGDGGTTEQHVIAPVQGDTSGTQWRYQVGDRAVYLKEVPGESLGIVSEADADQGVLTRYAPSEPLLIAGMNAGDRRQLTLNVSVYDLSDPDDLEHTGTLDTVLTYVGAYRVTVPAGSFDAALLRWDFRGKIGPATVEDIQVRLVAPGIGMVAAAEKRDVAAFLIYNDNTKQGKVLAQKP